VARFLLVLLLPTALLSGPYAAVSRGKYTQEQILRLQAIYAECLTNRTWARGLSPVIRAGVHHGALVGLGVIGDGSAIPLIEPFTNDGYFEMRRTHPMTLKKEEEPFKRPRQRCGPGARSEACRARTVRQCPAA
jgi:hypothetical protein